MCGPASPVARRVTAVVALAGVIMEARFARLDRPEAYPTLDGAAVMCGPRPA